MTREGIFLIGLGISLTASLSIIFYLRRPLDKILIDLCGTEDRAKFWASITHIALVLNPLILALTFKPVLSNGLIFEIRKPMMFSLIGLVFTIFSMSFFISIFIPRRDKANLPRSSANNLQQG